MDTDRTSLLVAGVYSGLQSYMISSYRIGMVEMVKRTKGSHRRTSGPVGEERELLADRVYLSLKENVLDNVFAPGDRLNMHALATQLEVSPTPVREALARLAAENLVDTECWRDTPFISGLTCDKCGTPLPGDETGEDILRDDCMTIPRPWTKGRAAILYQGNGRKLVLAFKPGKSRWPS